MFLLSFLVSERRAKNLPKEKIKSNQKVALVKYGMDEETATTYATIKIDGEIADKEDREKKLADKKIEDKKQAEDDRKELIRVAKVIGREEVPAFITRFAINTIAIKEEVDGVVVETGKKVNKVRLYFTLNGNALEINQLMKSYKTDVELTGAIESAKLELLSILLK